MPTIVCSHDNNTARHAVARCVVEKVCMMMMMILVYLRSHQLDNYKDRSPGLHMWTLPPLGPSSRPPTHHQNFKKKQFISPSPASPDAWPALPSWKSILHTFPAASPLFIPCPAPLSNHKCCNPLPDPVSSSISRAFALPLSHTMAPSTYPLSLGCSPSY